MRARLSSFRIFRKAQDGQSLVLAALLAPLILASVGLAVDAGRVLGTRAELQKATDAAALAGAQDLPNADQALVVAQQYVSLNTGDEAASEALIESRSGSNDTIVVSARQYVGFTFLKVIGLEGVTVDASAVGTMTRGTVTGYIVEAVAPFSLWGGARSSEVHASDAGCALHICGGSSYTFLDTDWMGANGDPLAPDWMASNSQNFKGDLSHGDETEIVEVGGEWKMQSVGGFGSVEPPSPGDLIVVPIFTEATGNSNLRTFTIGGFALLQVEFGCTKQHCSGVVIPPTSAAADLPDGWTVNGDILPPEALRYTVAEVGLTQ